MQFPAPGQQFSMSVIACFQQLSWNAHKNGELYRIYRIDPKVFLADTFYVVSARQQITPRRRIRVLIADDHPVIRKIVRSTLERHPYLDVCGEAVDGAQAVEKAKEIKARCCRAQWDRRPAMHPIPATFYIKRRDTLRSQIVILSSNVDKRFLEEAKRVGAHAYVVKSKAGAALVAAIEAVVEGEGFCVLNNSVGRA